jgi:hypothetical protein
VGCWHCHQAKKGEPDAFEHEGVTFAMVVTPRLNLDGSLGSCRP